MKAARLMSRWIILAPMVIDCAGDPTCQHGGYPAVMVRVTDASGGESTPFFPRHRPSRRRIAASASTIDS